MADAEETPRDEEYPELLSLRDNLCSLEILAEDFRVSFPLVS